MQVCSACRAENRAGSRFCSSCGASLAPAPFDEPEVHRIVTVLFCDLMGSTRLGESLDSESLRRVMSRYYEEMRRVLERHGHPACRFIGDAVMAVFGIPTLSEDDAVRAVRAADEMRTALTELNEELERRWGVRLSARTGVNTGEVVVDARSGDELFVVGDAVNVAARLEQAAPEAEILIGEETYRLVRGAVEVEPVEPLTLRGKSRPVTAHRVLEVHPEASGIERLDSPFVGRERELELLDDAFQRSLAERNCVVITVLGEAGVGKSRVTHEFLGRLGDRGRVVRGRCLPHGAGTTFWPIAGVVKEAAAISEEDSPEAARAKVSRLLTGADDSHVIAERVAGAVGLAEPAAHREETFWAVRKLLEAIALEGPLVVAFDDIHLGEPTFLDLIEHIAGASKGQPMLLVCTSRPELLEERPAFPNGGGGGSVLRLSPLGERESRVMVENLMGGGELAEEGIERVTRAAEGNPLFLEQIVRMLIDERRGHLDADGAALALPPTIQALVAARLDRLTPAERALAQRASVVGREFWPGALYELSPDASRREVNGHLEALLDKQLVRPGGTPFAGEDAICFTHLLIRDVAYQAMLKEVRAELHERFAAWLERGAGDRASEYEEILGYHLEQACRYREKLGLAGERTVALAREAAQRIGVAGRRALARGDTPAARNLLERAVSLLPDDDPLQRELSLKLSIALAETGELSRADAVLSERIAAERRGRQFLVYRDGSGRQQVAELEPTQPRVTIGRKAENDICLGWDSEVSRRHADIEWVGDRWELVDERLSHNGSHVNGERVDGRRGLKDGDVLRFGETAMLYRAPTLSGRRLPSPAESASTATRPLADDPS